MKSVLTVKYVLTIAVVLSVMVLLGDVASFEPPPPHAMSHAEWTARRYSALWRIGIPCSAAGTFIVALLFSVRRKRPSIMFWLAFSAPVAFLLPIVYQEALFDTCILSILGISAVSGLISFVHCSYEGNAVKAALLMFAVPISFVVLFTLGGLMWFGTEVTTFLGGMNVIEDRSNETYDEYRKRAEGIIFHHCSRCDKPMKNYGRANYGRAYWRCPDCDRGEITCSKCGTQKNCVAQVPWQRGFKWKCPNCDQDSVPNKEYVEKFSPVNTKKEFIGY